MEKVYVRSYAILSLIGLFMSAVDSFSLANNDPANKVSDRSVLPPATRLSGQALQAAPPHSSYYDPIRFTLKADKQSVAPGEEVIITITATHLPISSALLFSFADAKGFRLKVLMPKGFTQTGGSYVDYVGTTLSAERPTVVYTIKGHFSDYSGAGQFRLLHGPQHADATSLFIEKAQLPIRVQPTAQAQQARAESTNNVTLSADCGTSTLTISGYLSISKPRVTIVLYRDNAYIGSISDVTGPSFNQTYPISGSGLYYARVVEVDNDGNTVNASAQVNCSSAPTPPISPTPPVSPTPPANPSPPATGGSLAFQIVSYECSSGVLQYQVTGGNGSSVYVDLPGIMAGNVTAGSIMTYIFPGDGRTGRTVTGSASQAGQQIAINFTNGCNQSQNPPAEPPANPTPPTNPTPPSTDCSGTGGGGLTGSYINGLDFSQTPAAVRQDAQINFTWPDSPIPGVIAPDYFSVHWSGQVEAPVTGTYTFKTYNDDGTRLQVNGQTLINDGDGHPPVPQQGSITLTAGQKYTIDIYYFELSGGAQAQLYWEYPGQASQLIPTCRLYPR